MIKRIILHTLIVLSGIITAFLPLELALRVKQNISKGIALSLNPKDLWDDETGWKGKEHILGPDRSAVKILVIGDSFTEGLNSPSSEMWFAYLPRQPDNRLLAYGGLGYGNLQELSVLKEYLEKFSPDTIILQLCSNDFLNNYYPLEKESLLQRAPAPRPYLEDGTINLRIPRPWDSFWKLLIGYSRLGDFFSQKWQERAVMQVKEGKADTVESEIQRHGWGFKPFAQSVQVTRELLRQFAEASQGKQLYFLLIDDMEPYTTAFRQIAHELKVPLFNPRHKEQLPIQAMHKDGAHLNALGNKIIGEAFSDYMQNLPKIPSTQDLPLP